MGEVAVMPAPRLVKLLVPIDFSGGSRLLLRWSVRMAEAFGAKVSLVGIAEARAETDRVAGSVEPCMQARALELWRECEVPGELQGGTMVPLPSGADGMVAAVRAFSADLVVAAAARTGVVGWRGWWHRNAFEQALRRLPCSVLSINPEFLERGFPSPGLIAPLSWQSLLVWDDGRSDSAGTIAWAAELARRTHAAVTIVRYFDQALRGMRTQPFTTRRGAAGERALVERRLMAQIGLHDWGQGRPRILFRNGHGDAGAVCRLASRMGADLVLIRAPRDRPWWRLLPVDRTLELVRAAPCPVLSVPG